MGNRCIREWIKGILYKMKYTIILIETADFGMHSAKGVFDTIDEAIEFASEDHACRNLYHWTVVKLEEIDEK